MNIFTLIGDLLHLLSILILLLKITTTQSCRGLSLKTQSIYLIVFIFRYLDLFWNFESIYNYIMKIVFISTSAMIVYLMVANRLPIKQSSNQSIALTISSTYEPAKDDFFLPFLIVPCLILCAVTTANYSISEFLWTFSIWLEAVAIVPQLHTVRRNAIESGGFIEPLTSDYVFCLGGYRFLYLINWIFRFFTEPHYSNWISWTAGTIQTIIYCDFFYYYAKAKLTGQKMTLPI